MSIPATTIPALEAVNTITVVPAAVAAAETKPEGKPKKPRKPRTKKPKEPEQDGDQKMAGDDAAGATTEEETKKAKGGKKKAAGKRKKKGDKEEESQPAAEEAKKPEEDEDLKPFLTEEEHRALAVAAEIAQAAIVQAAASVAMKTGATTDEEGGKKKARKPRKPKEPKDPKAPKAKKAAKTTKEGDAPSEEKKASLCTVPGCVGKPTYGLPGEPGKYCPSHKEPGMLQDSKKTCKTSLPLRKTCKRPATHGWKIPEACEEHSSANHANLVERACVSCKLLDVVGSDGQCGKCNSAVNHRLVLAKINELLEYLQDKRKHHFVDAHVKAFLTDPAVATAAGVRRLPDGVFSAPTHHVLLFVDVPGIEALPPADEQHADMKRLVEVAKQHAPATTGFLPLIFIRFNPDQFASMDNATKKKFNKSLKARREHLVARLKELLALVPAEEASLIWIFFDQYSEKDTKLKSLNLSTAAAMADGGTQYTATLASASSAVGPSVATVAAGAAISSSASSVPSGAVATTSVFTAQPPTMSSLAVKTALAAFDGKVAVQAAAKAGVDVTSHNSTGSLFSEAFPALVSVTA